MIIVLIVLLAFIVRIYKLDSIPGSMWGDVTTHFHLAKQILDGHPFTDYIFGADGPLFSYVVSLFSFLGGLSFYTMKLATAIIGTLFVLVLYFHAKEFFKKKEIAYIIAFLAAVSFWGITFSRQAKPHILVPLFISLTIYFILKKRYWIAGIFLGLGMYTQASFWGMFFLSISHWHIVVVAGIVSFFLFRQMIVHPDYLVAPTSFIGEKFNASAHISILGYIKIILAGLVTNLLSFNVRGDEIFRHNIPNHPHLDWVTGIFFILGWIFVLFHVYKKKDRNYLLLLIVPFFMVQIPSLLDTHNYHGIPNMGRMIGTLPFACMFAGYGIYQSSKKIRHKQGRKVFIGVILLIIATINLYNYFIVYPKTLPNNNLPSDKIIAEFIDKEPMGERIVAECCFGEWGAPEQDAIVLQLKKPRPIEIVDSAHFQFSCQDIIGQNTVFIVPPMRLQSGIFFNCENELSKTFLKQNEETAAVVLRGR